VTSRNYCVHCGVTLLLCALWRNVTICVHCTPLYHDLYCDWLYGSQGIGLQNGYNNCRYECYVLPYHTPCSPPRWQGSMLNWSLMPMLVDQPHVRCRLTTIVVSGVDTSWRLRILRIYRAVTARHESARLEGTLDWSTRVQSSMLPKDAQILAQKIWMNCVRCHLGNATKCSEGISGTDVVLLADTFWAFKLPSVNQPKMTCFERVVLSLWVYCSLPIVRII
jgi:hypothetical protein